MARDIEEFLRKAAERRAQAQRGGQAGAAPPPRPAAPQQRPVSPPRQQERVVDAVIIQPEMVNESLRDRLEQQERAAAMHPVDQADEKLESHLNQVFDHDLGSLQQGSSGRSPATAATQDLSTADELLKMIRNPQSLRSAIILREILERPEHRW